MSKLRKMVQQKRIKVLIFTILLCVGIYYADADDLPNVAFYASNNSALCVANGEARKSAIAWIHPFENEQIQIKSYYVPNIQNSFNVNFNKGPPLEAEWKIKNWFISDGRSLDAIIDTRWEDFPVLTSTKQFKHTNDASLPFTQSNLGFSILANKNVEILLCEGWNHMEYPFYYLNIGGNNSKEVYFKKYSSYPEKFDYISTYKTNANILSAEDWKTFFLTYEANTGYLELLYIKDNQYVPIVFNNKDEKPLKPMYFLTRSEEDGAKWKFHDNYYLFTNKSDEFVFGPQFDAPNQEICISLYVALCEKCTISFYIFNNHSKEILLELTPITDTPWKSAKIDWREIRLIKKDNLQDSVQVYVSTKFVNSENIKNITPFWAIDNVRVCTENEIKISSISSKRINLNQKSISCQLLKHQKWRPFKEILPTYEKLPILTANPTQTSITIKWSENTFKEALRVYKYKGIGVCSKTPFYRNIERDKSSGYISSKENEIILNNLIPYTLYNVSVFDPIFNWTNTYTFHTIPTEKPLLEEIPTNIQVDLSKKSQVYITANELTCNHKYGFIWYKINIYNEANLIKNTTSILPKFQINNLEDFTNYSVEMLIARDQEYFKHLDLTLSASKNFTTPPGVAKRVTNLEAYSSDLNSISLRFGLPSVKNGIATNMRVTVCQSVSSITARYCKPSVYDLNKNICPLWDDLYCINLTSLRPTQITRYQIEIKNNDTKNFGPESIGASFTKLRVPGAPLDVKYEIFNCEYSCHINITWKHPFNQNSTINRFEIELKKLESDNMEIIKDNFIVDQYQRIYSKIIRYIPFGTSYDILIRSSNQAYTSEYSIINVTTGHIGDHINQSAILLNTTTTTAIFKLTPLDERLESCLMTVIVQDSDVGKNYTDDIYNFAENDLCSNYGDTWIAAIIQITKNSDLMLTIGNKNQYNTPITNESMVNKPLKPGETYCFTFVIKNKYENEEHVNIYHINNVKTEDSINEIPADIKIADLSYSHFTTGVLSFLFVFILVSIGYAGYKFYQRGSFVELRRSEEHIYMSLDDLPTSVSNQTYDKLIQT